MVKYYSTHCGACETISWLLTSRGIEYTIVDNDSEVMEAAERYKAETFPFAVIDDEFFNTQQLVNYILEYDK